MSGKPRLKTMRIRTIHALRSGLPLCGFNTKLPKDWPPGHAWANVGSGHITCPKCKRRIKAEAAYARDQIREPIGGVGPPPARPKTSRPPASPSPPD